MLRRSVGHILHRLSLVKKKDKDFDTFEKFRPRAYRTTTFQDFLKSKQRKLRITGLSHIYLFRNNTYLLVLHFTAFPRDSTGVTALEYGANFCLFVAIRANRCLLSRLLVKGIHSARKIFSRSSCCVIRLVVSLLHLWARYSLTDVKTCPSRGPLKLK